MPYVQRIGRINAARPRAIPDPAHRIPDPARRRARPKTGGGALVTTYGYDEMTGELKSVDYNDSTPDITYTYDRLGRQATVTDGVGSRTFGYDSNTQLLSTETMTGVTPPS